MDSTSDVSRQQVLIFRNPRQWFGNPRLGCITVWIDRAKVGRIQSPGTLETPVTPGIHMVRVGQWWFRSVSYTISVGLSECLVVECISPRDGNFFKQMLVFMFAPWRALRVRVFDPGGPTTDVLHNDCGECSTGGTEGQVSRTTSRGMLLAEGLFGLLGFLVLLTGLHVGRLITGTGVLLVLVGVFLAIQTHLSGRGRSG